MEKKLLLQILQYWVKTLYEENHSLIKQEGAERNLLAQLMCYVKPKIKKLWYDVDVEYNREWEWNDPKKGSKNNATTADFLIHTRTDTANWNILYLEAKTYFNISDENKKNDIDNIIHFMNKFKYKYWMFMLFEKNKVAYKLFERENGEIIGNPEKFF